MTGLGITMESGLLVAFGAAALAGLTGSLHCFAMCGPLACAGCAKAERNRGRAMAAYHLARVAGYVAVGALLGAFGQAAASRLALSTSGWLPWVMAGLLVATALGVFERLPLLAPAAKLLRPAAKFSATASPRVRSAVLGAVTPLLPCGLLYALYLSAAVSGSATAGAVVAGGFALAGVPALTLAQLQTGWMQRLPRAGAFVVRRVVPLAAAAMLVWRAVSGPDCPGCIG